MSRLWIGRGVLPPDLLQSASRRLSLLGLVMVIITGLAYFVNVILPALGGPRIMPSFEIVHVLTLAMMALSLSLFLVARAEGISPERKLDCGLFFEVSLAFLIVVPIRLTAAERHLLPEFGVSEICILILFTPIIVPNRTWKVFLASILAATADPISVHLASLRGAETPPLPKLVEAFLWNYLCAGMAIVPAVVLNRLARHMKEARELGSYRLIERIGSGGMGEVWRADHQLLSRDAAVKIIRPEKLEVRGAEVKRMLLRFEMEAQATAALRSPHTIDLYDFGITGEGTFFYVMELLDGVDLGTLVERFGPLPAERVAFLLGQACHSLADAHAAGLIHRDIKPANLFACRQGLDCDFVKVLDFGLVKGSPGGEEGEALLSDEQTVKGTPAYIAPETARGGEVDGRADLYSLGCVAYWLLTGRLVFDGKTPMEMIIRHAKEEPDPPSRWAEIPVPPEFERIVLRCLAKEPSRRPESAEELRRMIRSCSFERPWTDERAREWWQLNMPRPS
jgi:tRNA A-37 threonylcarbamoyl transferase component Bud32